jgi:hypothetical protein
VELTVTVTKGSPRTCTFRPYSLEEDISLPAVNVLAKQHKGMLYVIAVSSQERPVTAAISGLPEGIDELEVFGEERPPDTGGNRVRVEDGAFSDSFPWLTVHLYRARLD